MSPKDSAHEHHLQKSWRRNKPTPQIFLKGVSFISKTTTDPSRQADGGSHHRIGEEGSSQVVGASAALARRETLWYPVGSKYQN